MDYFITVKTIGATFLYDYYADTNKCGVLPIGTVVKLDSHETTENRILIVDHPDPRINGKYVSLKSFNFELVEE